ncbi:MAG: tyrosine--tRNA ligase, partial [Burkholderiaceae bacterium]
VLEGLDGVEKMSKSKGNYVGIAESPDEMFGKLMSISDTLMWKYFTLLSFRPLAELSALQEQAAAGRNPRDIKVELAQEIVTRFHSRQAAEQALANFESRFKQGEIPTDLPVVEVGAGPLGILAVLKQAGLAPSTSEAGRNLDQGGVRIDGEKVVDRGLQLAAGEYVVQVGKRRFAKVVIA